MKKFLFILFIGVSCTIYADLADDLEDCIGYYIHSSYSYNGQISGSVNGLELRLGQFRVKITEYEYLYEYSPTIILLYNPDNRRVKIIINDEILDAILL